MPKIQSNPEKKDKAKYKIINWGAYNQSLIRRGVFTFWIEDEVIQAWYDDGPAQRGAQFYYSDECITCLLGLKAVFSLGYRQTQGFAESLIGLTGYEVEVPRYSQISRRAEGCPWTLKPQRVKALYI